MLDIRCLQYTDLLSFCEKIGEKSYRAGQIYSWIHRGVNSFEEMTDLSKELRDKLSNIAYLKNIKIIDQLNSADGTVKFINILNDNNIIESVFMKYHHGNSLCLSTQVGCKMKCLFCASGIKGFVRNLSAGEMLAQILEAQNVLKEKINNVVLMGTGEPLDNLDEVLKFINIINDKHGLNISDRNITLSTCGIIPGLRILADKGLKITVAISLHNTFQEERIKLMPIAKQYPVGELFEAIDYYIYKTKRRVTIEYTLIRNLNDTDRHANHLGKLLR
jgi:23S rRNA (adenine2503-C2)-methyltransferase